MTKTCPSCGFVSNSEARFCRMCGAMLPRAPEEFGDDSVSPSASTVPLSRSRPTTGDLSPHDTGTPDHPLTARLGGGEMEEFLRRASEAGNAAFADDASKQNAASVERPLTIRVRPIDSQSTTTTEPPSSSDTPSSDSSLAAPSDSAAKLAGANSSAPLRDGRDHSSAAISADAGHAPTTSTPATAQTVTQSSTASTVAQSSNVSVVAAPSSAAVDGTRAASNQSGDGARPASSSSSKPSVRRSTEDRALRVWAGAAVFGVIAVLVCAGVVVAWYAVHRLRRAPVTETTTAVPAASAPTTEEARQSAGAKLAEAEQLIASGRESEAVARLREAAALDPANAEPHRRLARLLLAEGARRTAIEELRAVVRIDPNDATGWRDLAAAQSAEGLHADAAESYRSLFGTSGEAARDDHLQLLYADALRLSGRTSEAQSLYKRLASSRVAEVARASRQRLTPANDNEEANNANSARVAATPNVASNNSAARDSRASTEAARATDANKAQAEARPTPATLPVAAPAKDHFERGVELWRTNRSAALTEMGTAAQGGNPDASYYLGLNLAEGRDPRALKRAELVAALTYFQRARHGRFASEARRYEDTLGREYDRRRASGEP